MKTRIDVEKVKESYKQSHYYNNLNLKEIDLYENGEKIEISDELIEEWRFVGLGLEYFIITDTYKNGMNYS